MQVAERPARWLRDSGRVENRLERTLSKRCVSVMRNGYGMLGYGILPDVMATADAVQHIAVSCKEEFDFSCSQRFHARTRARRARGAFAGRSLSMAIDRYASRQPRAASMTLARVSAFVSPSETQPGMAGTSPQYPPSAALWMTTFHPFSVVKNSLMKRSVANFPGMRRTGTRVDGTARGIA